jgi:predicted dehydrogenase
MKLRLIQVGMGGWGRNWAKNIIAQNQDVELAACVDTVPAMVELAKKEHLPTQRYFSSVAEALASVEADAVLVTASLAGHVPVALEALNAGKHVLLEKPFAPTIAEARSVVERAEQRGRILMISQNYRYHPAVQLVRRLIQQQRLGEVGMVNLDFRRYANSAPRESQANYGFWQPLLVDMAIHHFDLMRMLLGQEPTRITCQTWNPSWSKFDEDAAGSATITFDGGTVVSYRGNWVSAQPQTNWAGEWHIECARGEIMVTSRGEKPDAVATRLPGKRLRALKLPEVPLLDRSGTLAAFVQAVQSGEEPETSGRRNLKTLALTLASVEAATTGLPVAIAADNELVKA